MADSDFVALIANLVALRAELSRFEGKLDAFREHFEVRFDQQTELIRSEVKNLCFQISNPKKN
jgi:hypothetical protein